MWVSTLCSLITKLLIPPCNRHAPGNRHGHKTLGNNHHQLRSSLFVNPHHAVASKRPSQRVSKPPRAVAQSVAHDVCHPRKLVLAAAVASNCLHCLACQAKVALASAQCCPLTCVRLSVCQMSLTAVRAGLGDSAASLRLMHRRSTKVNFEATVAILLSRFLSGTSRSLRSVILPVRLSRF